MPVKPSNFYHRQTAILGVGQEGLAKLGSSTVAVVGLGGVGSSAAYYLARSGVGTIRLIDQDIIETSNLQRIHSATQEDLFHPKSEVLAHRLSEFDGSIKAIPVVETITEKNVHKLLDGVDLVFDGLDNFRTRYILNRFAMNGKIPYMFTSAVAQQAHFALLNPPNTPCLQCIMPRVSDRFEDSCESLGVGPTITGLAGTIGAQTAIQFFLEGTSRLMNEMLTIDLASLEFLFSKTSKRTDCAVCSGTRSFVQDSESSVTMLCGERTANILPPKIIDINLSKAASTISVESMLFSSEAVVVFRQGPHIVSLFRNGRLLIGEVEDETQAAEIARRVWESLPEWEIASDI